MKSQAAQRLEAFLPVDRPGNAQGSLPTSIYKDIQVIRPDAPCASPERLLRQSLATEMAMARADLVATLDRVKALINRIEDIHLATNLSAYWVPYIEAAITDHHILSGPFINITEAIEELERQIDLA